MATVFVTLCDKAYFSRATQTIRDLRGVGQWTGDVVLIAVDFSPNSAWQQEYSVRLVSFPRVSTTSFLEALRETPLDPPTCDRREFEKLTQWEKLHVFDPFFGAWDRVVFLDAGLRVLDTVELLLALPWQGRVLAPDDNPGEDPSKTFRCQLSTRGAPGRDAEALAKAYDPALLDARYFLNCLWIYDAALLKTYSLKAEMLELVERFPIWRTNEMGVMNVVLCFQHGLWSPLPIFSTGRPTYLFEWCESNRPGTTWRDYAALKYPMTLSGDVPNPPALQ